MKIKLQQILIFVFFTGNTIAQDPHFSNMSATLHYTNPSYIAVSEYARISSTYRNQSPGLNSAYLTYCASFLLPVDTWKSAFGINLIHDNQAQGALTKTSVSGIYSYTVKISRFMDMAAGLGISYNFRNINENRFVFETDITGTGSMAVPINYADFRSDYGDFSLGFTAIFDKRFFSGISVSHITQPVEHSGSSDYNSLSRRYAVHAGGIFSLSHIRVNKDIFILPGIMFQHQDQYQELLYGTNLKLSSFEFGLWARQNLRFNFDAIILLTGFSWQQYNFFYSYDVSLKNLNFFSTGIGAHEVTFSIDFQYKDKRKKMGAIKCPKI